MGGFSRGCTAICQKSHGIGFGRDCGRNWLQGHEEKPEWAFVWQCLVELGFESDRLLPIGRNWLQGRKGQAEYRYVYKVVYGRWPPR